MKKESNKDSSKRANLSRKLRQIDDEGDVYKQIFEHSVIPIVVHDLEMNIIKVNNSAVELFGYQRTEFLQKSIYELHTEDGLSYSADVLKKVQKMNKLSTESSFKRKDGSVFIAAVTPCKYLVGDRHIVHVYIEDITEKRKAQTELKELNSTLEAQVNKVKKQSREIKKNNQELETFGFVAAHDLKAPLTNIVALADMLNSESFTNRKSSEIYSKLKGSISVMKKTVDTLNSVIDFKTKLDQGVERLEFAKILNDVKVSISEQLEASDAQIKEDFSECPEVDYPPLHLSSIVRNLLTNAAMYKAPERPLEIEVKTTRYNKRLCLSVKDNGLGFDAEKYRGKIFGLFNRLHPKVNGVGAGLYLVKSILDAHGGKIEVESKPNEGAYFKV